jgi:hypothetical protein
MRARRQRGGRVVDQETLAEAIGEGADVQHGRAFRAARSLWQGRAAARRTAVSGDGRNSLDFLRFIRLNRSF